MTFRLIFILFFSLTHSILFGQPCNYPLAPSNTCANAPILCDLDGYCSDNSKASDSGTPNGFCGIVENNNWVAFIAGSEKFELTITVKNCRNNNGLQAQIFSTSDCKNFISVSNCIDPVTSQANLKAENLIVGKKYYFMMDGKEGDVCDYSFKMISGETLSPAHAEIEQDGSLCVNSSLILKSIGTSTNNNLTYQWSTKDGNIKTETNRSNIEIDKEGYYKVVIEDSGGCKDSTEIFIPLHPNPDISIPDPPIIECEKDSIVSLKVISNNTNNSYLWSTQDGSILAGYNSSTLTVDRAGVYKIVLFDNESKCFSVDSVEVFEDIENPRAVASINDELNCLNKTLLLNSDGTSVGDNFLYLWTTINGNIVEGEKSLHPQVDKPGIYKLIVSNQTNSCISFDTVEINLNDKEPTGADIDLINPCYREKTGVIEIENVVGGIEPYKYLLDEKIIDNPERITKLKKGSYRLSIIDKTGCTWDTLIKIVEQPNYSVDLGEDVTVFLGEDVNLKATSNFPKEHYDSIVWTPPYDCNNCFERNFLPLNTTTYQIKVIDKNGCFANDYVHININKIRTIKIPNIFTPNGDDLNDIFYIKGGIDVLEIEEMKVFNRWGNLIWEKNHFQTNEPNNGWDGRYKDSPVNPGVYLYYIIVKFIDNEKEIYTGDITILR